jgi:hypothetical protein
MKICIHLPKAWYYGCSSHFAQKILGGMSIPPKLVRRMSKEAGAALMDQRRQDDARYGSGEGDE